VTLVALASAALGLASYLRYHVVEPASVGLVCDAGATSAICLIRRVFVGIFVYSGFGITALIAAGLALLRPSSLFVGVALVTGFLGVILYNTQLSALALALLPLVFARPAPPRGFQPE
jgi:hypothetical protein